MLSTTSQTNLINPKPDTHVTNLIHFYMRIRAPRPTLHSIFQNKHQRTLLTMALSRQIALIKRRSQSPDDGQVTVYDKALLVLTREGWDLMGVGALELFLTEFLGFGGEPGGPIDVGDVGVIERIEFEGILDRLSASNDISRSSATLSPESHVTAANTSQTNDKNNNLKKPDSLHTRVTRLLSTYRTAKEDYTRTRTTTGLEDITRIKFLRDTAENTIMYLVSNGLSDHRALPEVEGTFRWARDLAAELSGGRKRHFDDGRGVVRGARGREGTEKERERKREGRREKRKKVDSYRP